MARRSEPLALSAAAGSGKTSVLVERFVRAVREDGVAPAAILAITFTDRAAGELRERVRERLLSLGEREAARESEAASIGTFHALCARMLRAHPLPAGLDPQFAILDEGLAGSIRERAFREAAGSFLAGERPPAVDLIAAYGIDRVRRTIEDVHARLRSRGQREPRLPSVGAPEDRDARDAIVACALLDELLAGFDRAYERLKAERGAVDFDDLELLARSLLEDNDSVRSAWSERYALLMVDEFQDTNPRQLGILRALDRGNLFTVGDEFQSIYGFRDAEVALFRDRRAALAELGASLSLTSNFRSAAPLLEVVNAVFAPRFADFQLLRAGREREQPAAGGPPGQMPLFASGGPTEGEPLTELLLTDKRGWEQDGRLAEEIAAGLPSSQIWRQAEARLLAQRVEELVRRGSVRAGEVAVLLRAAGDLEVYERALQLRGLRTLAAAGGFWFQQQVGDLLAYLRTLANPLDEEALYGTLASPLVGISRDGLALLAAAARRAGRRVWELLGAPAEEGLLAELAEPERELLGAFHARLAREREGAPQRTLSELIERPIAASGYREHVLGLEWGERRLANVHKLLRLARRFEAGEGRDLRAFLDHVARLQRTAGERESDAPVEGVEPDAVRLMSIHAAKGLEFPVVCIADLGRAPNHRGPDLLVDGEQLGLLLVRLDGAGSTPALEYEELAARRRQQEDEEEDRILYVAMTRARERLLLSGAIEFERWPEPRPGGTPISWLAPALAAELPAIAAAGEPAVHDLAVAGTHVRVSLNTLANAGTVLTRGGMSVRAPPVPGILQKGTDIAPGSEPLTSSREPAAAPAPAGGRTMLSYTSLSSLERCGYRYYLEQVLGMGEVRAPEAGRSGVEARARGTLVHALLESHDFRSPRGPSSEEVAARARQLGVRVSRAEREEIAELIGGALGTPVAARVAAAPRVRRELPFAFAQSSNAGGPLIIGVIDLLAEEPSGARLVLDYKSDRLAAGVDLEAHVASEYAIQRLLYALAVLRSGAEGAEIVHWFLERPHEPVSASYRAAERGALEEQLAQLLDRAGAEGYRVSARPHRGLCLTCPGRGTLCSWGDSATLREDPDGDLDAIVPAEGA